MTTSLASPFKKLFKNISVEDMLAFLKEIIIFHQLHAIDEVVYILLYLVILTVFVFVTN